MESNEGKIEFKKPKPLHEVDDIERAHRIDVANSAKELHEHAIMYYGGALSKDFLRAMTETFF